ncbi:hypothetical protein D3C75_552800 [compost metagenome]
MLIIISLAMTLFLCLPVKGFALLINSKFGGNIRSEHLHAFINPIIISIIIYSAPKLTIFLGYQP